MATYISLINWTEQGIQNYKETTQRSDMIGKLVEQYGGKLEKVYWTIGEYDAVAVIEAPDDETATAVLLQVGAQGNVRTKSLRAFDRAEMDAIIDRTR